MRSLVSLLALIFTASPALAQWDQVCPARTSFFELNLRQENYQTPEDLMQSFTADGSVDFLILGEAHFQPTLERTGELLGLIAEQPEYNCLFIEATHYSWKDEVEIASEFGPDHPLYFIRKFHQQVQFLPMSVHFVDERGPFEKWLSEHFSPLPLEDLKELAYEEITYRNSVMSRRIGDAMRNGCRKGVLLIGSSHLSSVSRGYPVFGIKELLQKEGLNPKAIHLLDSEFFYGVDETLNVSAPSPSLCFKACSLNPELPQEEVAFVHKYPEGVLKSDLALIDAARVDAHYGTPTMGLWSDFDATVIFPPKFISSCQDPARY